MRYSSLKLGLVVAGTVLASSSSGCSSEEVSDAASPSCVSTREYFTTEVYGKAMKVCAGCHTPGGAADQKGAKFRILRDTYPDFVSANLDSLRDYVKLDYDGKPLFLLKPLGKRDHGGGAVLTEDSEDFKILTKMVTDLRTGNEKTCDGNAQLGVEYLDSRETARKAGIVLAGRVPTDDELGKAAADEGLDQLRPRAHARGALLRSPPRDSGTTRSSPIAVSTPASAPRSTTHLSSTTTNGLAIRRRIASGPRPRSPRSRCGSSNTSFATICRSPTS